MTDPYVLDRIALISNLEIDDVGLIVEAILELGRRGRKRGIARKSVELLSHRSPRVRAAAAQTVGKLNVRSGVGPLIDLVANQREKRGVRETAAYALGLLADSRALEPLQAVVAEAKKDDALALLHRCAAGAALQLTQTKAHCQGTVCTS